MKRGYGDMSLADDNVWYYNATIKNGSVTADGTLAGAQFQDPRAVPLLTSCDGWRVALARLSVVGASAQLPIFSPLLRNAVSAPDETAYSVTLEALDANNVPLAYSRQWLRWVPQHRAVKKSDGKYLWAHDYQWVANMMNDALVRASEDVAVKLPVGTTLAAPTFPAVRSWSTIESLASGTSITISAPNNTFAVTYASFNTTTQQWVADSASAFNYTVTIPPATYATPAAVATAISTAMNGLQSTAAGASVLSASCSVVATLNGKQELSVTLFSTQLPVSTPSVFIRQSLPAFLNGESVAAVQSLDFRNASVLAAQLGIPPALNIPQSVQTLNPDPRYPGGVITVTTANSGIQLSYATFNPTLSKWTAQGGVNSTISIFMTPGTYTPDQFTAMLQTTLQQAGGNSGGGQITLGNVGIVKNANQYTPTFSILIDGVEQSFTTPESPNPYEPPGTISQCYLIDKANSTASTLLGFGAGTDGFLVPTLSRLLSAPLAYAQLTWSYGFTVVPDPQPTLGYKEAVYNADGKSWNTIGKASGSYAYMDFSASNQLYSLHFDPSLFISPSTPSTVTTRLRLYFNENLRNMLPFNAIRFAETDGEDGRAFAVDTMGSCQGYIASPNTCYNSSQTGTVVAPEVVVSQPYNSTASWPPYVGLAITSQQIPAVPESSGSVRVGSSGDSGTSSTSLNTVPVIFDLDFASQFAHDACAGVSFVPSQFRFAKLKDAPLTGIDFRLLLKRRDGSYEEWDTSDDGVVSVKLMFVKGQGAS